MGLVDGRWVRNGRAGLSPEPLFRSPLPRFPPPPWACPGGQARADDRELDGAASGRATGEHRSDRAKRRSRPAPRARGGLSAGCRRPSGGERQRACPARPPAMREARAAPPVRATGPGPEPRERSSEARVASEGRQGSEGAAAQARSRAGGGAGGRAGASAASTRAGEADAGRGNRGPHRRAERAVEGSGREWKGVEGSGPLRRVTKRPAWRRVRRGGRGCPAGGRGPRGSR